MDGQRMDSDVRAVRDAALALPGRHDELGGVIREAAGFPVVLIGEATHGTHEFYSARALITRRLIERHGFCAVAAEADWPDAYRVNRFVHGRGADERAEEALGDFVRFPRWMWRNGDVLGFVRWLRAFNGGRPPARRAGFYGLDLYSLHASMAAVVEYLEKVDPAAAAQARARYACFDQFGPDPHRYGMEASWGESCERQVAEQLEDLRRRRADYLSRDGLVAEDELFFAEQNARLARSAERYYRTMFSGRISSWNLRDTHMVETLAALRRHLGRRWDPPRVVVWAHNSHVGDSRATEMGERGEVNIGRLAREAWPGECFIIGFSTYEGTVAAASDWGGPVERRNVRPALPGSWEDVFHRSGLGRFWLELRDSPIGGARLQRAIGVVYRPDTERLSHYFHARPDRQFDALIHYDRTRAVEPLDAVPGWISEDIPETYPSGL